MSKPLTRTYSLRKQVRPITDINEDDDDQRRDSTGRKRVDVVQCLLDSSSDEIDDIKVNIEKLNNILWLTFTEICHIRSVLTQTSLSLLMFSDDQDYSKIRRGRLCFRCRKKINEFFFLPAFLRPIDYDICFICRQTICKKCSFENFMPPSHKLSIPIRIQNLIKPSPTLFQNEQKNTNKSNAQSRTACYDCLQVFNEHMTTSQSHTKPPVNTFRRTNSLPPISSKTSDETHHIRHRRRPIPITNDKTIISTTPSSIND